MLFDRHVQHSIELLNDAPQKYFENVFAFASFEVHVIDDSRGCVKCNRAEAAFGTQ